MGTPLAWIQPIWCEKRMNRNSSIENPTRKPSARAVFRVLPLSRIMKNRAEPRLPMISRNAMAMTIFTKQIVARGPVRPGPAGAAR